MYLQMSDFFCNFVLSKTKENHTNTIFIMIESMTGFGKAERIIGGRRLVVEIKSLNSKQLDLNIRLHPSLRAMDLSIRSMLAPRLERGKVDISLSLEDVMQAEGSSVTPVHRAAYSYHMQELAELCPALTEAERAMLVLRMPDVIRAAEPAEPTEEELTQINQTILEAMEHFSAFRKQEGAALQAMFAEKLDAIAALLAEVEPYEKNRVERIRQHLLSGLDKLAEETRTKVDSNRLEQEMIFYLEKLDITEEKVRLKNHIRYFRETMGPEAVSGQQSAVSNQRSEAGVGKKLGFIAQEMGREINTLGSKSNQSEMQIIVVKMKDLLEQIKEQVLNVL
jgi:uncharacterized protein (TIGR00255 family)